MPETSRPSKPTPATPATPSMPAPRNRLSKLPTFLSYWLGYRATPPPKRPNYLIWLWSFIGAFAGLSILQAVFGHAEYFLKRKVPSIIASYGASAVLCYGAIEAPLAQPRALVGGHFISALIGLCITKLFALSSHWESLRWLAGSLSASVAIVVMQMTATTHPPAGATALLAAVNDEVFEIGWYYLPVILLSSTLILAVALLINNIQRRYPVYWFEPAAPPAPPPPAPSVSPSAYELDTYKQGKNISRVLTEGDEAGIEAMEVLEDRIV